MLHCAGTGRSTDLCTVSIRLLPFNTVIIKWLLIFLLHESFFLYFKPSLHILFYIYVKDLPET